MPTEKKHRCPGCGAEFTCETGEAHFDAPPDSQERDDSTDTDDLIEDDERPHVEKIKRHNRYFRE